VTLVMMDDYLLPCGEGLALCPETAHYSCRRAAREEIVGVINRGLPEGRRLAAGAVWFPDPAHPGAYDARLAAAGGIDLFITASGASDGHVAFNGPGSALDSASRVVALAASTRRDNLRTFPRFQGLDEVPAHGVTIGLGTIRSLAREVLLLVCGAGKRDAVRRLAGCRGFDPQWPASFIFRCRRPRILLDQEAVS
jgi:glucosamine-6-phosphate deaminase